MVEKTIFIVKPIYIPVEVPITPKSKSEAISFIGNKNLRQRNKMQKAIYMERQRPPNYTNPMASALIDRPKKIKNKQKKVS
jgi:hypothetical protein